MDHSVELAGWWHWKSCGEHLYGQGETSDEWHSSEAISETSTNQHLCQCHGQWDWGYPEQVSCWHQAVWCGQHAAWKDAVQRDMDRFERWGHSDLMKFNKCEVQVQGPTVGLGQSQAHTGWGETGSSPKEKVLGMLVDMKFSISQQCMLAVQKATILWAAFKVLWPSGQGRWLSPSILFLWDPTWHMTSNYGACSIGRMETWCSKSRERPQRGSEG